MINDNAENKEYTVDNAIEDLGIMKILEIEKRTILNTDFLSSKVFKVEQTQEEQIYENVINMLEDYKKYKEIYKYYGLDISKDHTLSLTENELYQELELIVDSIKVGEAEVDIKNKMLSRLYIYEPYQDKGFGKQFVRMLNEKYGCNYLWVKADNDRARHVYESNGYRKSEPTMYLMERKND